MHCFSGDAAFARACLDRGAYLSFAGTVTFKNAAAAARRAGRHPAGPAPGRDRRAVPDARALPRPPQRVVPRPAHVRAMAEVRGDDLEALCRAVDANTEAAFGGPW